MGTPSYNLKGVVQLASVNAQVGVTYTAVLADADKIITLTNAAAIAMTIPANASVAYPIGTKLNFQQLGAGAVTVGITSDTLLINAGASLSASDHRWQILRSTPPKSNATIRGDICAPVYLLGTFS